MTSRVEVVPLIRLAKAGVAYTYGVPEELSQSVRVGQLVHIPFRTRRVSGIVVDLDRQSSVPELRDIEGIEDEQPALLPFQLDLALWMASEYVAPMADVVASMLPAAVKRSKASSFTRTPGALLLTITDDGRKALDDPDKLKGAPAQRKVLEYLRRVPEPSFRTDLIKNEVASRVSLKRLEERGFLSSGMAETLAARSTSCPGSHTPSKRFVLSPAQEHAVGAILPSLKTCEPDRSVFLLHGVTGSGKTEVYMSLIAEVLRLDRQAIVLVPEISLTPQAVSRFSGRFGGRVAALHSKLSERERREEWRRIRRGQASIVIGPRSALFAPLDRLGIIIVDEEHDSSYKQSDSPRYHARDVAVRIGSTLNIPIVLGSATPDIGTYHAARHGRFHLLNLPDRPVWDGHDDRKKRRDKKTTPIHSARSMPPVETVDLRQELKAGHRGIFSRALLDALTNTLRAGHQSLLFMNRRGTATAVVCRDCGYVAKCERCDIPLTYHASNRSLICHRCNRRQNSPRTCRACGSDRIRYLGVGTQRVVEEVERVFPQARVMRWDKDVTGRKDAHETIARGFGRHEADVLVGTQMIAKGLDFPLVTLVGVIVADVGLHLPDFRSAERTFQLMTQVAGRAGRSNLPSRVIVQTYSPEHYALQAAKTHDYWSFYQQEITFRRASGYPPFSRLARLIFRGKDNGGVQRRSVEVREELIQASKNRKAGPIELTGPAPAYFARVDDVFQWHLLVRGSCVHDLLDVVPDDVVIDVDPVELL